MDTDKLTNDSTGTTNWFTTIPIHLRISTTASSGRGLYVAPNCRLQRGQVALSTCPTAVCISARHSNFTCACCLGRNASPEFPEEPVPCKLRCRICKSASWCSKACKTQSKARHAVECPLLARLAHTTNRHIKREEREHIVILASTLASLGSGSDVNGSSQRTNTEGKRMWLQEIHSLVEQDWGKPGSKKCRRVMQDAATKVHSWGGAEMKCPCAMNLQHALRTGPMNDVGLWDERGESIGRCVAPIFALTNHSCLPNCAQIISNGNVQLIALCDIESGEELTHSYVNLNVCDREQTMLRSWQFKCRCIRCHTPLSPLVSTFDTKHLCRCGGVVLERRYVDPNKTPREEECQCNMLQML